VKGKRKNVLLTLDEKKRKGKGMVPLWPKEEKGGKKRTHVMRKNKKTPQLPRASMARLRTRGQVIPKKKGSLRGTKIPPREEKTGDYPSTNEGTIFLTKKVEGEEGTP